MRAKYLFLLIIPVIYLFSCGKERNKFTISGSIGNMPQQQIFLEELGINDIVTIDSVKSDSKGAFKLSGIAPEPGLYRIRFEGQRYILVSVDKDDIKVDGDWDNLQNYTINGSPASASLKQFLTTVREHLRDFNTMSIVIDSMQARGNDSMLASAKGELEQMNVQFTRYIEEYSDTTKYLPNALFAARMLNPMVEKEFLDAFASNLPSRFHDSKLAKDFIADYNRIMARQNMQQAQVAKGPTVGAAAPELSLPTPEGKQVSLSSMKGKYVLVDFWASWCGPCRKENPNVLAAYNKFKDKNFTVLGISLDDDKDKWTSAIEKDELPWTHVSDLKGWESVAARTYAVEAIPTNFLVDPTGKIIARDLRGEALESKLQEVLK